MKKRIMLGFSTLAMVALVLIGCIIGTLIDTPSVQTSAANGEKIVYAISYNDCSRPDSLSIMGHDIEYIRSLGLRFILPTELNTGSTGGIILVIELRGGENVKDILALIEKHDACAVFSIDRNCSDVDLKIIKNAVGSKKAELAYVFETCSSEPVDMIAAFAEARLEFFSHYGTECSIFMHKCSEPLCTRASLSEGSYLANTFIFGYGNGKNTLALPCKGIVGLNRILRLPDWTIEEYFSSIAE